MLTAEISFINSITNIFKKVIGADMKVVAAAMGLDKRIGPIRLR